MDSAPPQTAQGTTDEPVPRSVTELPPEALALATRMFSAARNGDEQSIALLTAALARGLPPNLTNDKGDTLIMLAAYHGHVSLVRLLLQRGADPNVLNDRGQSPLAGVVFKNERECVEALLEGGADPEIGEPTALAACDVFKMAEFKAMFETQIQKLRPGSKPMAGESHAAQSVNSAS